MSGKNVIIIRNKESINNPEKNLILLTKEKSRFCFGKTVPNPQISRITTYLIFEDKNCSMNQHFVRNITQI